jgi:hypothetical protein
MTGLGLQFWLLKIMLPSFLFIIRKFKLSYLNIDTLILKKVILRFF